MWFRLLAVKVPWPMPRTAPVTGKSLVLAFRAGYGLGASRRQKRPEIPMQSILSLADTILGLYMWCIIIAAVMSWLSYGGVINNSNRFVYLVSDFLYRITEPAMRPIRRFIPSISGIDLSPIVLILAIFFLRSLIREYAG